jgi:opacity protein-like surface antigen
MNTRLRYGLLMALGLAAVPAAQAADSPWSVSVFGGGALAEDGQLRMPVTRSIADLGSIDPALSGTSGSIDLDRLNFNDLYRHRYLAGAEVDYDYLPDVQAFGRFNYESGDGRNRAIGSFTEGTDPTHTPIAGHFSDEDTWSLDLGTRVYFPVSESFRPFAGIALGATRVSGIKAALALPDETPDVRFTRTGTVFSQSIEAGVQYAAMQNLDLRFAIDATHFGSLPAVRNPTTLEADLQTNQSTRDRWAFPVSLGAVYHF